MNLKKVDKIDILLIILSILCFGSSTHWLYRDYNDFQADASSHTTVGKVIAFKNKVKRKFSDSLVWYPAKDEGVVYEGDWIFTGANSTITIEFDDGGTLEIEPDSLVVLRRDNGGLDIQLTHGSLLANLNESANISIDDGQSESLTNAKGKFQVTKKNKQSQIQVLAGAANFKGQTIKKNEQLVSDKGQLIKEQMGIQLKLPLDGAGLRLGPKRLVDLRWETLEQGPYQVEFSTNLNFTESVKKEVAQKKVALASPFLGLVYWRVQSLGSKGEKRPPSSPRKYFAKLNQAPKLISPLHLSKSGTFEDFPTPLDFSWSDPTGSWTHYDMQVSTTPKFNNLLADKRDLLTQAARIELPEPGTYFWRARGIDLEKKGFSRWSPVAQFEFVQKELGPVEPLELVKKDIVYPLNLKDLNRIERDGKLSLTKNNAPLRIRWEPNPEATSYTIKLATDAELKTQAQELQVSTNELKLDTVYSGRSYYSVHPNFEREREAPTSQGTIKAYLPGPKNLKVVDVNGSKELRWFEKKSKLGYEVQYRMMTKKSYSWKSLFVEHGSVISPFQEEAFQWKVRMVDLDKRKTRSYFSKVQVHTPVVETKAPASVEPAPPPRGPHPTFTHPEKKKTFLVSLGAPTFVLFRWKHPTKADGYELEIARNEAMSQILMTKNIKRKSKFVLKTELNAGIYYYRVRADLGGKKSEWSDIQQFRVAGQ